MKKSENMKEKLMDNTTKITTVNTDDFKEEAPPPLYSSDSGGVYYHTFSKRDKEVIESKTRLSDQIDLIGCGIDDSNDYYRVFEWRDKLTREKRTGVIACADIGSDWKVLQSKGIGVHAGRNKRDRLADYLQNEGKKTEYLITNQTGWIDNNRAYILPNGEILGDTDKRVIFNGDTSQAKYYATRGTLEQWNESIGRYAVGNSRVMLAIGASLSAPLMRLLDIEGGGFHLFGDSSDGKTTVAKAALSVWGKADDLKLSWTGTNHAFSNIANARNDNFLLLDEIGQATARTVSQTAYSLLNGVGKAQGHKDGGNRHLSRYRVLMLSTGEKTLETFLKRNHEDFHAGQANRLPSIPANANKGYGVYDTLHNFTDGAALSEWLSHESNQCYGVAGRAFVEKLISDTEGAIKRVTDSMGAFMASLPPLTGQSRRVANRFALVASALELANDYGVMAFPHGGAMLAIKRCFDDWLAREGAGKLEDRQIIEQVEAFIERYGDTDRFMLFIDKTAPRDFAGYREEVSDDFDNITSVKYYTIPPVFNTEICEGFDPDKVKRTLIENGILKRSKDGFQTVKKVNKKSQRFYLLEVKTDAETTE